MSSKDSARRVSVAIAFGGVDITKDIAKYLLSVTYTDCEDGETDDLQFELQDRDGLWTEKWLNTAMHAAIKRKAASSSTQTTTTVTEQVLTGYRTTAAVAVRSRAGEQYYQYGTIAAGMTVAVNSISNGWANITFEGKNAYCNAAYLTPIYSQTTRQVTTQNTASGGSSGSSGNWKIGDQVTVTGTPYISSYGGSPGAAVTNYTATITYLNLNAGVPYPICVGQIGWFAESAVSGGSGSGGNTVREGAASEGLYIQASIVRSNWNSDGKDDYLDCGQFQLDSVESSGPPAKVKIKATSLPYSSTVRQTKKSRSWENYYLSGIVSEIASANGMTSMFLVGNNPLYKRIEQYRTSDIEFLTKLCRDSGSSLKVSNNIIVVFNPSSGGKSAFTLEKGKSQIIKWKHSTSTNGKYDMCRVSCTKADGSVISGVAYAADYDPEKSKGQTLNITQNVNSIAEAQSVAAAQLTFANQFDLKPTFTIPFNPRAIAGVTVTLKGYGPWNGRWVISKAVHKIATSSTTDLTLRRA